MSCRSVVVYTMLGVLLVLCRSSFGQPTVRDDLELQKVTVSVIPPGQQPRTSRQPPPPPPQTGPSTEHPTAPPPPPSPSPTSSSSSHSMVTSHPPPPPRTSSSLVTRPTSAAVKTSTTIKTTTTTTKQPDDGQDDDDSSDGDSHGSPGHRPKRQSTGPADLAYLGNTLNDLRRMVGAADMYYVSWDPQLEKIAAGLTSTCHLQSETELFLPSDKPPPTEPDLPIVDAQGLTGYVYVSAVGSVLGKIYERDLKDPFYRQITWPQMAHMGCAIGNKTCTDGRRRGNVFACIFTYTSHVPVDPQLLWYRGGANCSSCDPDAIWCDDGLCRRRCRPNGVSCDTCDQQCSSCSSIINSCHCICHYDGDRTRCEESTAKATEYVPICRAKSDKRNSVWIAVTIGVTGILVIVVISIACCVRRCREMTVCRRRSASPRSTTAVQPVTTDTATMTTTTPATSPASSTSVVVLPPPYEAVVRPNPDDDDLANKPPPYCFEPPLFVVPTPCPSYEAATAAAVAGCAPTSGGGPPNRTAPSGERRRTTNRVDSTHVNRAFESDTHHI